MGAGGEMTQALYAHMNNNKKKKNKEVSLVFLVLGGVEYYLSFSM
jgi:hypothetical protein